MKMKRIVLPFGCALALVCLSGPGIAAGQSSASQNQASEQTAVIANRVTQSVDQNQRVTLAGNVHPLARTAASRGQAADSLPMERILLLLKRSEAQEAALEGLVEAQQDKSSPNYHKWLTPEDFGKQFGPSDSDIQAVTDWLTAQGFHNVRVAAGRNVIEFSGSAGTIRQAFHTQMQNFEINGVIYSANSADPQIPAALAPVIAGTVSLHNFPKKAHLRFRGDVQKNSHTGKLQPLFTFPDPSTGDGNFYGVGPGDFATIYNSKPLIAGGNDGTGQTIAIVGETQINPKDVGDFRTMFGLNNNFTASNVILNGSDPGITSMDEESESDLDVEWSGAVAPGATVKFVVSASTTASAGIDLSAMYIIEHNLADVMSESYGECEKGLGSTGNAFYKQLWEQAAAQGITVVVSSGDGGSAGCDDFNGQTMATQGLAVSGIAGTPFNVSVGGTDFNQFQTQSTYWLTTNDSVTGTSVKGYIPEFPWNENCSQIGLTGCGSSAPGGSVNIVAGSGGASSVYAKPTWQIGVTGVPNDNHRDQPDVSLFASPGFEESGYLFCQSDLTGIATCNLDSPDFTFHVIGGTSASAPAFAGVMALVNQYAATHGGTSRQGNANVTLYALAKKAGASCASSVTEASGCIFNDVAKPNIHFPTGAASISVACKGGSPNCSATIPSQTGVLVTDPAKPTTEAWTAGAGYDLATGLGTLNINNLATIWTSASTLPTTTTLSVTPSTGITHGQNENVAVTVGVKPATGTGIASGDVALLAMQTGGTTLGVDQFTLTNGAITSAKTQNLPGGTYKIFAHYAGDGTNAPSDSPPVQVTVGKEASQTFLVIPAFDAQGKETSTNANSLPYGSSYIIRMYAANSAATANTGSANFGAPNGACFLLNEATCPTGSVTLTANGTPIDGGTFPLNSDGYTRDLAPTLSGGTYSLVAKYSGDTSYNASTSATATLTLTPAPTALTLFPVGQTITGQTFFVELQGVPNVISGAIPTGTVSILDGATVVSGPIPVEAIGIGQNPQFLQTIQLKFTTGGDHSLTAKYSGDVNYAAATSSPQVTHTLFSTTTNITVSSQKINFGQTITINATVNTGQKSPVPGGQISFGASNQLGTINAGATSQTTDTNGNIVLQATATTIPQLNETVSAFYPGDNNYAFSVSAEAGVTVAIPDFTMTPANGIAVVPDAGQAGSTSITITPLSQTPSIVTLSGCCGFAPNMIAGYTLTFAPQQVNLSGSATTAVITLTPLGAAPASAIREQNRHILFLGFNRSDWFSLSLTAAIGFALVILFFPIRRLRSRLALAPGLLCLLCFAMGCGGGGGVATGGGGTGGSGGSTSTPPGPSTIVLTTSNAKVSQNTPVTITATVTGATPLAGTVQFFDFGVPVGGVFPLSAGLAQLPPFAFNNIGVHQITANYSGDAKNLSSTSQGLAQTITGTQTVAMQGNTGGDFHSIQITVGVQ